MGYAVDMLVPGIVMAVIVIAGVFALLVRRHLERADAREFGSGDTGGPAVLSGTEGSAHDCAGLFAGGDCGGGDGGGGGD